MEPSQRARCAMAADAPENPLSWDDIGAAYRPRELVPAPAPDPEGLRPPIVEAVELLRAENDRKRAALQATKLVEPMAEGSGFRLTRLDDLMSEPEEPVSWLLEGILPAGGLSLLAAKPKVGKSTLARNLALAVARGDEFLNRITVQGPVI